MISFRIYLAVFFLFFPGLIFSQEEDSLSSETRPELFVVDTSYFEKDNEGYNLIIATDKGDLIAMEILLRRGVNPDSKTFDGVTPLMYASEQGNSEAVLMLLDHGADPNLMPDYGPDALISSSKNGSVGVSATLLDYGALINEKDENGLTALMYASAYNFAEITDLYLSYGADPSIRDGFGSDALIIASYYGSYESARILLEYGYDINTTDNFGFTPLIIASQAGRYDMVWLFIENGADISRKSMRGYDALALSVIKGYTDITELLIENGAEVNNPVHQGNNPLDIAKERKDEDMVNLLKTNGARNNPLPYFNLFSAGCGIDFSKNDFMVGLYSGIHESKYGVDIRGQLYYRPAPIRVLVEETDETGFQFWERRWMATAGIHKKFNFETASGHVLGPFLGLDITYTWGSYRGADRRPHPDVVLSPVGGLFWKKNNLGADLKYSYKELRIPDFSPHRISLGFIYYFNITSKKLMFKEISWF
jgi:ankyrin repeat protein